MLLHRVGNATQLLSGVDALLSIDSTAIESRSGDLGEAARRVDEAGWLLALLASAVGSDMLLERRERRGLAALVDCVRGGLQREDRDLASADRPLPHLSPTVADGWQLPWAIGSLLYHCGRTLPRHGSLEWSLCAGDEAARLECHASLGAAVGEFSAWLARELPLARLLSSAGSTVLELPAGWLVESKDSP